jgi:hypothetical protein
MKAIHPSVPRGTLTRRQVLTRIGGGFGALALGSVFADAGLLAADARIAGELQDE